MDIGENDHFPLFVLIHSFNSFTALSSTTDDANGGILPSERVATRCSKTERSG